MTYKFFGLIGGIAAIALAAGSGACIVNVDDDGMGGNGGDSSTTTAAGVGGSAATGGGSNGDGGADPCADGDGADCTSCVADATAGACATDIGDCNDDDDAFGEDCVTCADALTACETDGCPETSELCTDSVDLYNAVNACWCTECGTECTCACSG